MPPVASAHDALRAFLPASHVGEVEHIEPITTGLSGAQVYAVTTARGAYVLRVQARVHDEAFFAQHLRILRRAADAGVAPAVAHADESAHAVVSQRIAGAPMSAALADPANRVAMIASLVDRLRVLHALDASGIDERDPVAYTRAAWGAVRERPGFPSWAAALETVIADGEASLSRDRRRVLSHNDVNPANVLWDGARAWLVDWEMAAVGHPYFDLATLALFLRLPDEVALDLCARHDGAALDAVAEATFRSLRRLVGVMCGLTFLGLVDDLRVLSAPTKADAPSLAECYEAMRAGRLDVQRPIGRASMGLALLVEGLGP